MGGEFIKVFRLSTRARCSGVLESVKRTANSPGSLRESRLSRLNVSVNCLKSLITGARVFATKTICNERLCGCRLDFSTHFVRSKWHYIIYSLSEAKPFSCEYPMRLTMRSELTMTHCESLTATCFLSFALYSDKIYHNAEQFILSP